MLSRCAAAGAALLIAAAATMPAAATPEELDAVRRECIAAARDTQRREQAVIAIEREIDLLGRDADARRRGLDETRPQQARLLATLAYIARHPPEGRIVSAATPIDRLRGEALMHAAAPALNTLTRALAGEIARIAMLRRQIAAKPGDLDAALQALAAERERLAALTARRSELTRRLLPEDSAAPARVARLGREAKELGDLIRSADAASDRRDKELLARARAAQPRRQSPPSAEMADPTRPRVLRVLAQNAGEPPHPVLLTPSVAGRISRRFGESGSSGAPIAGVGLSALAGAAIVAPFDGRIVYAGPFRDFGLVLIMRHAGAYHSVLAGLGRIDANIDQWVLAGEPIGAMSEPPGGMLYYELRRDGRPVDPEPRLAPRDDGRDDRVRSEPAR